MHINSHMAIGIIIASIIHAILKLTLLEFTLIVFFSFIVDFDVFFSKFAKDRNHRNLISHSVIPPIVIIFLGLFFFWPVLMVCGFTYLLHIIIDTFDWGTNFFFFPKKTFGLRFLISKEEEENLEEFLEEFKNPRSFFDFKYYRSKFSLFMEFTLFIAMLICFILFALEYIYLIVIYFLGLYFHLSVHYKLKRLENT